jgi:hypothetical protein
VSIIDGILANNNQDVAFTSPAAVTDIIYTGADTDSTATWGTACVDIGDSSAVFVNEGAGNYRLQDDDTVCKNAGTTGISPDLDENSRPVDEWDMGAYENQVPDTTPTATPTSTPTWTPTWTATSTPTWTATATRTWTRTVTRTLVDGASVTPTASPTASPTWTVTATETWTPTHTTTHTKTWTSTSTETTTPTATPTVTRTATPSASPTQTPHRANVLGSDDIWSMFYHQGRELCRIN